MKALVVTLLASLFGGLYIEVSAQIINVPKRVENKVVNRVNRNIDRGIDKGLDAVEKDVKDEVKGDNKSGTQGKETEKKTDQSKSTDSKQSQVSLQSYSKYDFVPGEKVIFYDDFTDGNIGDFPVQWNTTSSGEVVTTNLYEGRWFNITNGHGATVLDKPIALPENYTIEFDVVKQQDPKNNNGSDFSFEILSTSKPKDIGYGNARPGDAAIRFSFEYSTRYGTYYQDGSPDLSGIDNIRLLVGKKYKISIWVQKERIRMYVDEKKVFDLPKAMSKNYKYNMIRFDRGVVMFGNIRIATGLPDVRNKLLTEGKLVTYGIYFDVNKDVVKPESYGTLKGIADILNEVPDVKVKIVGHTDADGADAANLDLSKRRAASVKAELVKSFNVKGDRLVTDGMGESQPVAPNDTPANKAMNRRVEFIKL
jgi:outer membrane protein OmpA-like peptidoglycan-associated protein